MRFNLQFSVLLIGFFIINFAITIKPLEISQLKRNVDDAEKLQLRKRYEMSKNKFRRKNVNHINEYVERKNNVIEEAFLEDQIPCLDRSQQYQKRPRNITTIHVQIGILGIHSFSSSDMEMSADIYLYQDWTDHRCIFESTTGKHNITIYARPNGLTHKGLQNLWQPDTHLLNAKKIENPETVTHIWKRGKVISRTRMSVRATCPMNLALFPMDRQVCSLIFQSSAHPNNEVRYKWRESMDLDFVQGIDYQNKMTPAFRILGYKLKEGRSLIDQLTQGVYDQLIVDLILERPLGYYLWEVYMPATFIVLMSFTSLWLDRSAVPARVSLGVTTVLTTTTIMSSVKSDLPHTSYPKAIGIFLQGCFLFNFVTLMEYSIAGYMERKRARNINNANGKDDITSVTDSEPCSKKNSVTANPFISASRGQARKRKFTLGSLYDLRGLRPSAVDVYARVILPVSFIAFQIIYWIACFQMMPSIPEGTILL